MNQGPNATTPSINITRTDRDVEFVADRDRISFTVASTIEAERATKALKRRSNLGRSR